MDINEFMEMGLTLFIGWTSGYNPTHTYSHSLTQKDTHGLITGLHTAIHFDPLLRIIKSR